MKNAESIIKLFGMTNQIIEADLAEIEKRHNLDLGLRPKSQEEKDAVYYPQFDKAIRDEATSMAQHYEIFYCLEKSIRQIITERLEDADGPNWWNGSRIIHNLQSEVKKRMQRDLDSGTTPRSSEPLNFTTFGELGGIIVSNWDIFGDLFNSQKAVEKVMASLNTLRGPIAHCSPLAEDEVLRLQLSVRDWFRLME
jgi:Swt1-like HEPN